jgi:RimJ/RimL family protein N-acetyltransferase
MSRRIPVLETERLIIRELTIDDLESINNVLNRTFDRQVSIDDRQAWLEWTVLGYDMFDMLDQPHYGERAIVLKKTGEIIGAVGIVPYLDTFNSVATFDRAPDDPATAEVGLFWGIDPAHQRQGYAVEAARAVIEYLFGVMKLGRVIATTGPNNLPSQKVMQKLGMTLQPLNEPHMPHPQVVGVLENNSL